MDIRYPATPEERPRILVVEPNRTRPFFKAAETGQGDARRPWGRPRDPDRRAARSAARRSKGVDGVVTVMPALSRPPPSFDVLGKGRSRIKSGMTEIPAPPAR